MDGNRLTPIEIKMVRGAFEKRDRLRMEAQNEENEAVTLLGLQLGVSYVFDFVNGTVSVAGVPDGDAAELPFPVPAEGGEQETAQA